MSVSQASPQSSESEADSISYEILEGLRKDFYFYLARPITEEVFHQITLRLGSPLRSEEVKLYASIH